MTALAVGRTFEECAANGNSGSKKDVQVAGSGYERGAYVHGAATRGEDGALTPCWTGRSSKCVGLFARLVTYW